jgi:cobalt transporter subunit CbtB
MRDHTSLAAPDSLGTVEISRRVAPALVAMLLGGFLVLGVGFAQIDAIHNAAHDSRHSFAFPCH